MVAAVGVGRMVARRRRPLQPSGQDGWYVVQRGITVDRPMDAVIGFWTDRERLDRALAEWATLEQLDDNRWRCVASDPAGGGTEWRAELTVDGPGRLSWRVTEGPVAAAGAGRAGPRARRPGHRDPRPSCAGGPTRSAGCWAWTTRPTTRSWALRDTLRRIKSLVEAA